MDKTIAIVLLTALCSFGFSQKPSYKDKVVLFGNLHAHGELSLDIGKRKRKELQTLKAYQYAMDHGLDFLALTEHHKATDSPGTRKLRISPEDYKEKLLDVASDFSNRNYGEFIAIAGIEWGNTKTGNHINLFGLRELPPDNILDRDYDKLISWATSNAEFIQFNHPNSQKGRKKLGNYGVKLFHNDAAFIDAADEITKTISLITSVRGGHIGGKHRKSEAKTHRHGQWEIYYKEFLNRGFHISPSANQDTHGPNWGTVTAARTAVWADAVNFNGLMEGFRQNRVYATEDDELVVAYTIKYGGVDYWMGDQLNLINNEEELTIKVSVWQAAGTDGDDLNEGPYKVVVNYDEGLGGEMAKDVQEFMINDGEEKEFSITAKKGSYAYLRIIETNGKDNPIGDFDLDRNGIRDDLNDTAWTSPIWFN